MSDLSSSSRAAGYLERADEMQALAEKAFDPQVAASLYGLAAQWRLLAAEALRFGRRFGGDPEAPEKRDSPP